MGRRPTPPLIRAPCERRRRHDRSLSAEELVCEAERLLGFGAVGGTPLHDQ